MTETHTLPTANLPIRTHFCYKMDHNNTDKKRALSVWTCEWEWEAMCSTHRPGMRAVRHR